MSRIGGYRQVGIADSSCVWSCRSVMKGTLGCRDRRNDMRVERHDRRPLADGVQARQRSEPVLCHNPLPRSIPRMRKHALSLFYHRNSLRSKLIKKLIARLIPKLRVSRSFLRHQCLSSSLLFRSFVWAIKYEKEGSPTVSPRIWHISLHLRVCYSNALEMCATRRATINVPANRLRDGLWLIPSDFVVGEKPV
jgi:hypothetical protein